MGCTNLIQPLGHSLYPLRLTGSAADRIAGIGVQILSLRLWIMNNFGFRASSDRPLKKAHCRNTAFEDSEGYGHNCVTEQDTSATR